MRFGSSALLATQEAIVFCNRWITRTPQTTWPNKSASAGDWLLGRDTLLPHRPGRQGQRRMCPMTQHCAQAWPHSRGASRMLFTIRWRLALAPQRVRRTFSPKPLERRTPGVRSLQDLWEQQKRLSRPERAWCYWVCGHLRRAPPQLVSQ